MCNDILNPHPSRALTTAARAVAVALALLLAACASLGERETRIGGIEVVVWSRDATARGPMPVVVFSHGIHMCPTQARFLTRALAEAGYLVIAPRHADSNCQLSVELPDLSRLALKPWLLWNEDDYRDRAEDLRKVITAVRRDPRFRADPERLALAGHSLGGYTVLGLGGAWPAWTLPGVSAILALSPYSLPFQRSEGLRKLTAPVMYQGGTLDPAFTLPLAIPGGGYAQSPPPKYFVEIARAEHFAWTDWSPVGREAIVGYALAFLDRHVKGSPASVALAQRLPGAADFRFDVALR